MSDMTLALRLKVDGTAEVVGAANKVAGAVEEIGVAQRRAGAEAVAASGRVAGATRLTTQQLQTLQYTASDVVASLGSGMSPFTILMQQGGQVLQVFPRAAGAVLGIAAAAAAVGVPLAIVGSRMAQIASQTRELTAIMKAMGGQAGVTAGELRKMAESAISKGASSDDAYAATLALVRNRRLQGSEVFQEILVTAPDVAAALGTTMANAAEKLGEAFGNGAAGVKKLDDELGFLTVQQARQIRLMVDQGNEAGALGVAMQALQRRFAGTAVAMRGSWGEAVDEMGHAWTAFVDRVANSDIAQRIARGAAVAARGFRDGLRSESDDEKAVAATRHRVEVEKELAELQERTNRNPAINGRITYLREEVEKRRIEEEKLYEDLRRKAKEVGNREGNGLSIGNNLISPDEQKRIDELRSALDRERTAMRGTSSERQVRLAGLQAERAALEAGRGPQAAKEEGLIAEDRARLDLNVAAGDQMRLTNLQTAAAEALATSFFTISDDVRNGQMANNIFEEEMK
ncbi:hypothetical protein [Azospirillum doebereinerae]